MDLKETCAYERPPSKESNSGNGNFEFRNVSKLFRFDWNKIIAIAGTPALRPASVVIAVMPMLQDLSGSLNIDLQNAWFLWIASLLFLGALALIKFCGPSLIVDYPHYEAFKEHGHSHRWMLWLYTHALPNVPRPVHLLDEAIAKDLAYPIDDSCFDPVREAIGSMPARRYPNAAAEVVSKPAQVNRDIYLKFWSAADAYILPLEEDDSKLEQKVKELFWITYTDFASSKPKVRCLIWLLYGVGASLSAAAIFNNLLKVVG